MTQSNPDRKRVLLVDTSTYSHQAWHASDAIPNYKNECCRVGRGVVHRLGYARMEFEWDAIVCALDPEGGSAIRKAIFADYKGTRPAKDPDFIRQEKLLPSYLSALGLNPVVVHGMEADDLIGTIARVEEALGSWVGIISKDKDTMALVTDSVCLLRPVQVPDSHNPGKKKWVFKTYWPQDVFDETGVWPGQITDWLALQGDKVDNIPGVEKVGPTIATKWLQQFGTLEEIIRNAHDTKLFKGKIGDNLRAALDVLPMSQKLARVITDIDIEPSYWACKPSTPEKAQYLGRELLLRSDLLEWGAPGSSWGVRPELSAGVNPELKASSASTVNSATPTPASFPGSALHQPMNAPAPSHPAQEAPVRPTVSTTGATPTATPGAAASVPPAVLRPAAPAAPSATRWGARKAP